MGSHQSSHAHVNTNPPLESVDMQQSRNSENHCSVRGRKAASMKENTETDPTETTDRIEEDFSSFDDDDEAIEVPLAVMEEDDDEDDDEEESEDEEDMYDDDDDLLEEERERILEEMQQVKLVVDLYMHPEKPVQVDATCFARCFFGRPSAVMMTEEEVEVVDDILQDALALKTLAVHYMHPELPVKTTDPTIFGRNYFTRPSAVEQEERDVDEEREQVLAEMASLKKLAVDYLHPEMPVVTTDPTVFGRNFFTRPSAPQQEDMDEEERSQVLSEMAALKKLAVDHMHPEMPVVTTDPTIFGRNYFTRPSAPPQEDMVDDEERIQILAEMAALKKLAVDYMHPELPVVTTDPTVFGRNYFTRPSAPEHVVDREDEEELVQILADAVALKKGALDFAHPELPVMVTDPTVFGRNYFTRPSAAPQELPEDAEDRVVSLEEAASLKKSAVDYAHPELPCDTTDPTAMGRNYFNRPSAPGHSGFIHSSGYDNNEGKHDAHGDEASQEHHDHFEMDEDIWSNMYSSLHLPDEVALKGDDNRDSFKKISLSDDEEEEGKLSRSPSSVMLFEQGMEGY